MLFNFQRNSQLGSDSDGNWQSSQYSLVFDNGDWEFELSLEKSSKDPLEQSLQLSRTWDGECGLGSRQPATDSQVGWVSWQLVAKGPKHILSTFATRAVPQRDYKNLVSWLWPQDQTGPLTRQVERKVSALGDTCERHKAEQWSLPTQTPTVGLASTCTNYNNLLIFTSCKIPKCHVLFLGWPLSHSAVWDTTLLNDPDRHSITLMDGKWKERLTGC